MLSIILWSAAGLVICLASGLIALKASPENIKQLEKLTRNRALIQKAVSKRVVLRNTPKLTFKHDNSAQRGVDMVNLLDDIEQNLPTAPPLPEGETDPEI